jgi:diadenylate cyclase
MDQPMQPRGYRLLARLPRVSEEVAHQVIERFGSLAKVLRATAADLAEVPGVSPAQAQAIKEALGRLAESSILEQYG